jgi:hypothetical protein
MKSTQLGSVPAPQVAVVTLLLFAGCSSTAQYPAERHANDAVDIRTLSPRDYLRAVDPWERREIERDADAAYFAREKRRKEHCR